MLDIIIILDTYLFHVELFEQCWRYFVFVENHFLVSGVICITDSCIQHLKPSH